MLRRRRRGCRRPQLQQWGREHRPPAAPFPPTNPSAASSSPPPSARPFLGPASGPPPKTRPRTQRPRSCLDSSAWRRGRDSRSLSASMGGFHDVWGDVKGAEDAPAVGNVDG